MLSAALDYHRRGWSLVPMRMADKRPAGRWKRRQTDRANIVDLRKWFAGGKQQGIGVIFGKVSGDLAERDFDDLADYERWAAEYPALASTLPTVETRRGRRVLFIAAPGSIADYRKSIGKPDGTGAIKCGHGELRAGVGCYSVLPPSVHPLGHVYRWLVPLPEGALPIVDPVEAGLVPCNRENLGHLSDEHVDFGDAGEVAASNIDSNDNQLPVTNSSLRYTLDTLDPLLHERVLLAIGRTIPTHNGKRRTCSFRFARELKSMPEFEDAPAQAFEPIVREWHRRALPNIGTQPFEETLLDFLEGWGNVKHLIGQGPLDQAFERAQQAPLPEAALEYEQPKLRLLVALCRELQRAMPNEPIFLAVREGSRVLQVSYVHVSRWLRLLCLKGVLRLVKHASFEEGRAGRYRYLRDLN